MKILMLTGAILGFALGIALGLSAGADWPSTLWRACAAAAAMGLLMRWWSGVLMRGFREAVEQRRALEAAANPQPAGPAGPSTGLIPPKKK
jgi:galactitol-specific phosphotransferase system IIC component